MENVAIEVHDLTVTYNQKPALWDIDFEIPKGALVGVIGPNGSGKSTLIKSIMGIIEPSSGWVKVNDKGIDKVRHKVSYVPQRESVDWDFPTNVMDVVMMGRFGKSRDASICQSANSSIIWRATTASFYGKGTC